MDITLTFFVAAYFFVYFLTEPPHEDEKQKKMKGLFGYNSGKDSLLDNVPPISNFTV